ncbi:hypothetical protein C2S53_007702 [Perilla frutescens var. hirtella]|uniref:UspA domain-containing protein n=1 Tax=Perilla frutescens var. hirtella TaxID=608512 RepID=A0AAD4JEB0_PERFH|nr:hypothetical protein C2S53_007702 [Perilla frutescens var. hirtella]
MGKIVTKLPNFCLIRIRALVRVRPPPPPSIKSENQEKHSKEGRKDDSGGGASISGRKIMIVADSTVEAKNAVQWAFSYTVQNQDMVTLLHVTKPSKRDDQPISTDADVKVPEFLTRMKNSWQIKRPEVHIEVKVVEGKEKGLAVVAAVKKEGVAVLVVGQKKRFVTWRLMLMWAGNGGGGVAEYCVENASCMAIAVRRKSNKLGGYVVSTRRHKHFWLLA